MRLNAFLRSNTLGALLQLPRCFNCNATCTRTLSLGCHYVWHNFAARDVSANAQLCASAHSSLSNVAQPAVYFAAHCDSRLRPGCHFESLRTTRRSGSCAKLWSIVGQFFFSFIIYQSHFSPFRILILLLFVSFFCFLLFCLFSLLSFLSFFLFAFFRFFRFFLSCDCTQVDICSSVPDGVVCFFPSYFYLETIVGAWNDMGVLRATLRHKLIFVETRYFCIFFRWN